MSKLVLKIKYNRAKSDFERGKITEEEFRVTEEAFLSVNPSAMLRASSEQGTVNREQGTGNSEQLTLRLRSGQAGVSEQVSGNSEQGTVNKEQGAGNKETTSLNDEVRAYVDGLKVKLRDLDKKKAELCNQNVNTPASINTKHLVDQIMNCREEFQNLKDEIVRIETTGILKPEDAAVGDEFFEALTDDKFELNRLIKNLKINLKKDNDKMATAKTPQIKMKYATKIALAEKKLESMLSKFDIL